jgi:hypothetical protein
MNLRAVIGLYAAGFAKRNWAKDWSWNKDYYSGSDNAVGFPVSPVYTSDSAGVVADKVHPDACQTVAEKTSRVVVEEWDGTTWRRVSGTSPVEGTLINSISVTEQLSDKLVYSSMIKGTAPQLASDKLSWNVPVLKPGETAEFVFKVKVKDESAFPLCKVSDTVEMVNITTLTAGGISAVNSITAVVVDCPLVTAVNGSSADLVKVYPNPFTINTNVEMTGDGTVEIMTADGQLLEVKNIKGIENQLGESLLPGFYLLRINYNEKVSIVKLVKN